MQSQNEVLPPYRHILRIAEVEKRTGYKRCYIYRLIKKGLFPNQSRIGIRAVGWDSQAVDHWVEERLQKSN